MKVDFNKEEKKDRESDIYEDDFDEIDEDIQPEEDGDIDGSGMGIAKMGDSHGITVSQSLGIDPSVDSLRLEQYDHVEDVEIVNR